jgi:hypothetical protein
MRSPLEMLRAAKELAAQVLRDLLNRFRRE